MCCCGNMENANAANKAGSFSLKHKKQGIWVNEIIANSANADLGDKLKGG